MERFSWVVMLVFNIVLTGTGTAAAPNPGGTTYSFIYIKRPLYFMSLFLSKLHLD